MRRSRRFRRSHVFCACHIALACAALALAGCYDDEFPAGETAGNTAETEAGADDHDDHGAGGCEASAATPTVELAVAPVHLHPGVVATLTFAVNAEGTAISGLEPSLTYSIDGGAAVGPLPVSAGETAGTYVIERKLPVAGTYALEFGYSPCGTAEMAPFEIVVGGETH